MLERFRTEASQRFLECYRGVLNDSPHRWVPREAETPLLDLVNFQTLIATEVKQWKDVAETTGMKPH